MDRLAHKVLVGPRVRLVLDQRLTPELRRPPAEPCQPAAGPRHRRSTASSGRGLLRRARRAVVRPAGPPAAAPPAAAPPAAAPPVADRRQLQPRARSCGTRACGRVGRVCAAGRGRRAAPLTSRRVPATSRPPRRASDLPGRVRLASKSAPPVASPAVASPAVASPAVASPALARTTAAKARR